MRHRVWFPAIASFLGFILIVFRLALFQLVGSPGLSLAAVAQREPGIPLERARGRIYDRNLVPLTDFRSLSAACFPCLVLDVDGTASRLSEILGLDRYLILEMISRGDPVELKRGISQREASLLKSINGMFVVERRERYSTASVARHVIGYTDAEGEGLAGMEMAFDRRLRGSSPGAFCLYVDAMGKHVPGLGYRMRGDAERDGRLDVVLTIDGRIQAATERILDSQFRWEGAQAPRGAAIVVLDAHSGEILAMASRPNFDQSRVSECLADERGPLLNRAVCAYPPGSVFKIVTAAAAIEEGCIGLGEAFVCHGYARVGSLRFDCASVERGGHGVITFREALAESCNSVFIEVGQRVGAERLSRYAHLFGFGRTTGAVASGESPGHLPDHRGMAAGDLANMSIGQWRLTATPLQVAQAMTAVVNGGRMLPATLVKEVADARGLAVEVFPRPRPVRVMSASTAAWLRRALLDATRIGGASAAFVEDAGSAGKTGSAETGRKVDGKSVLHAWFVGYAPAYAPRYIICTFVEEGGYGGAVAAPLFRALMKDLLEEGGSDHP